MTIESEKEYQDYRANMEIIIAKGTKLGDMELLSEEDKREFIQLSRAIAEYEAAYHPLPGKASTLLTDAIREKMKEKGVNHLEYKGYKGTVEYSSEDGCFFGKVVGLCKDLVAYEGKTVAELRADFEAGIDSYLKGCRVDSVRPCKPLGRTSGFILD